MDNSGENDASTTQQQLLIYVYEGKRVLGTRKSTYQETIIACRHLFMNIPQNVQFSPYTRDQEIFDGQLTELSAESWSLLWDKVKTITVVRKPIQQAAQANEGNIALEFVDLNSENRLRLETPEDASILSVVNRVLEALFSGACRDDLRFLYEGRQLPVEQVDEPLTSWRVENNSTIHLMARLKSGKPWELSAIYPVVPIKSGTQQQNQQVTWSVKVHPNGDLTELTTGLDVSYLFWEAHTNLKSLDSPPPSPVMNGTQGIDTESFIPNDAVLTNENAVLLPADTITPYLDATLKALGLHTEARTSFITYWPPSFLKHKYVALRFLPQAAYEKAAPLEVSPTADVVTRIFMLFRGVKDDDLSVWSSAQLKSKDEVSFWVEKARVDVSRTLDTQLFGVIEWGGMELST